MTMNLKRKLYIMPLALLALGLLAAKASAQCVAGDIMWVSETVNADVGLAAGAGRCGTNTVAGAACNSSASPFGVQAAVDCYTRGVTIRILAGANDYGSASNSWNNRFDATKAVICNNCNRGGALPVKIEGWVNTGTQCLDLQQASCPVVMDFSTGTGDGWDCQGGGAPCSGWFWRGLRITEAAGHGIDVGGGTGPMGLANMELDNNGAKGWEGNAKTHGFYYDVYVHDNGTTGWDDSPSQYAAFLEAHDNATAGFDMSGFQTFLERSLSYTDAGTQNAPLTAAGSEQNIVLFSTLLGGSTLSGWAQSGGQSYGAGSFGNIYQRNAAFGMANYSSATQGRMSQWSYNMTCLNTSGTYSPAAPYFAGIENGNRDDLDEAFFTGGPNNYEATGFAPITYEWPGGVTSDDFCIGAASPTCAKVSFCGGSLGGFVGGARRIRKGFTLR